MSTTLEGVRFKLDRADEHIKESTRRVNAITANPYIVRPYHCGAGDGWDEWELRLSNVVQVPSDLGIPIGDAVHNLRSSLDHLMWQLVLLNGCTPTKRTQFPIFEDLDDYRCDSRAMRKGISKKHDALVKDLQPHQRVGDERNHPLWWLSELNNFDKHRLVLLANMVIPGLGLRTSVPHELDIESLAVFAPEAKDGAVIAKLKVFPHSPDAEVRMNPRVPCQIRFAKGNPSCVEDKPVIDTLQAIRMYIHDNVLAKFAPDFP